MINFSNIIRESQKNHESGALLKSEVTKYISRVNKKLPANVQKAIYLTQKYNICDRETLDTIRQANKSQLPSLDIAGMSPADLETLWGLMKDMGAKYKYMPQYMSPAQRQAIEAGKLALDDLTIDLETPAGRNAATKMYMPMIYTIVNQYAGTSKLSKPELVSAALEGFTEAMNTWRSGKSDPDKKHTSFRTYAAYMVKFKILHDINTHSHTISGSSYAYNKYGSALLDAVSLDNTDEFSQDHMTELGREDKPVGQEARMWDKLYAMLEKQFSQRNMDIFYRFFGLNGYKKEKSKDIAKSYGMSEGNIRNGVLNKMLKWLKTNVKASDILMDIQDLYTESLMIELVGSTREQIIESFLQNDVYILLEELTRWNNKDVFRQALEAALGQLKDPDGMLSIISGRFIDIDNNLKKSKKDIIAFLSAMYPTEPMNRKTDVDLLEYMEEIQDYYHKYHK